MSGSAIAASRFVARVASARIPKYPLVWLYQLKVSEHAGKLTKLRNELYIHDPKQLCNLGDIIIAEKKEKPVKMPVVLDTPKDWELENEPVSYEFEKTVFKIGNVVDPITGLRCSGTRFLDDADTTVPERIEERADFLEVTYTPPKAGRPWPLETEETKSLVDAPYPEFENIQRVRTLGNRRRIKKHFTRTRVSRGEVSRISPSTEPIN